MEIWTWIMVTVTFTAGYGTGAEDVPVAIRKAIILMVSEAWKERTAPEMSKYVKGLLGFYRVYDERVLEHV